MMLRTLTGATLVTLMLACGSAAAAGDNGLFRLPGVFGGSNGAQQPAAPPPIRLAQAGDPRITALEEQVRALNGTIEELNFQILQMQEQLRKMQEDNEFRFQEMEQGRGAGGQRQGRATPPAPPAETGAAPAATASTDGPARRTNGLPERTFGTITFDSRGNVTGGNVGDQATTEPLPEKPAQDGTTVAALPSTSNPDELYRNAYEFILSGDYRTAEAGFRDHIARFPKDSRAADAQFWLGEALLGQDRYRDAAEVFLAANKAYPKANKAPDMLLKLGIALVALDQRDVACATLAEVGRRYPSASGALRDRVKQEQALARC